jgi:hypothetical protein
MASVRHLRSSRGLSATTRAKRVGSVRAEEMRIRTISLDLLGQFLGLSELTLFKLGGRLARARHAGVFPVGQLSEPVC